MVRMRSASLPLPQLEPLLKPPALVETADSLGISAQESLYENKCSQAFPSWTSDSWEGRKIKYLNKYGRDYCSTQVWELLLQFFHANNCY